MHLKALKTKKLIDLQNLRNMIKQLIFFNNLTQSPDSKNGTYMQTKKKAKITVPYCIFQPKFV